MYMLANKYDIFIYKLKNGWGTERRENKGERDMHTYTKHQYYLNVLKE